MRRHFVTALALLSFALTGGSCEFRASTGAPIHPSPPAINSGDGNAGLVIVVNTGNSTPAPHGGTTQSSTLTAALAMSVLSIPDRPSPAPSTPTLRIQESDPVSNSLVATPIIPPIARPIPEPSGILLFGLGSVFIAWLRRN